MTSDFSRDVETIVGPVLTERGFHLDEIDDSPDEGGIERHIVYYRSNDCKIQVYYSAREGEVNCMIAPLDAPNQYGLLTKKWQFLGRFAKRPDVPPEDLLESAIAEYRAYANPLDWVRDRIVKYYEVAHNGILEMYGKE